MKKRVLAMIIGLCVVASMAGCGKKELSNDVIIIKEYKGLTVEEPKVVEVTDEDVEKSIKTTIEALNKNIAVTDRAVQKDDIITLDYAGKVDGEAFEGGTATDQKLTIGSGAFIPGFEDAIIGHKVGETFDINVTLPKEYNEKLAGKDAVFTITIDKIEVLPELTVELLKDLGTEATTIEDYKKEVKANLEKSNEEVAKSTLEQNVWNALIEQCEVSDYPDDKYDEVVKNIESQFGYVAQMYGTEVDELVKMYYGITVDEMAKNLLKQEMAIELIAKKERLTVSDKEYQAGLEKYAKQYGYDKVEDFEKTAGEESIKKMLVQEKVADWLLENCEKVEKKEEK